MHPGSVHLFARLGRRHASQGNHSYHQNAGLIADVCDCVRLCATVCDPQDSDAGSGSGGDDSDVDSELAYEMELEAALDNSYKEYLQRKVGCGCQRQVHSPGRMHPSCLWGRCGSGVHYILPEERPPPYLHLESVAVLVWSVP